MLRCPQGKPRLECPPGLLASFAPLTNDPHSPQVLRQLRQGAAIALVSDAGTPAINDPGADLVAAAAAEGLPVIPVPGASAVLAGLVASGLPTRQFLYCGFTAPKASARQKQFAALATQEATLVFYVSPHSLLAALGDAAAVLGPGRRWAGLMSVCEQSSHNKGPHAGVIGAANSFRPAAAVGKL